MIRSRARYLSWTSIDRVPRECISLLIVRGSGCPRKGAEEMAIVHAPGSGGLPMNLAGQFNQRSGIGRYADELQRQLVGRVRYISCDVTAGPLKGVPLLRQLPLMVRGLDRRAPLHFPKVLGAGVLWFQRLPPSVVTVHDLGLLVWPRESADVQSDRSRTASFVVLGAEVCRPIDRQFNLHEEHNPSISGHSIRTSSIGADGCRASRLLASRRCGPSVG